MNRSKVVIDLGFGDGGKGRVVDYLCSKTDYPMVIRYCGGDQAGHHVVRPDGTSHVFSHFGSGTFEGAATYWSSNCPVNPISLENEFHVLKNKGFAPEIFLCPKSPVVTPYDINWNLSTRMGRGTCGAGIFATMHREKSHYHLLVEDLFHPTVLKMKLSMISDYYKADIKNITGKIIGTALDLDDFMLSCEFLVNNKSIMMEDQMPNIIKYNRIFESSQGLLLDQDIGFFPHATPSSVGTKNLGKNLDIYLVTRAYQTRHGDGPMSPIVPNSIQENPYEQNKDNNLQGEFRKTLLDLDLIRYAVEKDELINSSETTLVITCLDLVPAELRLFSGGKIITCSSQSEFVDKIKDAAKASKLLVSTGAHGEITEA